MMYKEENIHMLTKPQENLLKMLLEWRSEFGQGDPMEVRGKDIRVAQGLSGAGLAVCTNGDIPSQTVAWHEVQQGTVIACNAAMRKRRNEGRRSWQFVITAGEARYGKDEIGFDEFDGVRWFHSPEFSYGTTAKFKRQYTRFLAKWAERVAVTSEDMFRKLYRLYAEGVGEINSG